MKKIPHARLLVARLRSSYLSLVNDVIIETALKTNVTAVLVPIAERLGLHHETELEF
jgi:hypothetical protein